MTCPPLQNSATYLCFPGFYRADKDFHLAWERREGKMKKALATALFAALAMAIAVPAAAGGIDKRQWNQQKRIHQGIRSGSLTPGETARLEREQLWFERRSGGPKGAGIF